MSTLQQRFALLAKAKPEITQADLARATGVSAPSVHAWFSGDTKSMKAVTASKAAQLYGCNTRWLSDGDGEIWPQRFEAQSLRPVNFGSASVGFGEPASEVHLSNLQTLSEAVDILATSLEALTEAARAEAAPLLQALLIAPDSKRLRHSLLVVLAKKR